MEKKNEISKIIFLIIITILLIILCCIFSGITNKTKINNKTINEDFFLLDNVNEEQLTKFNSINNFYFYEYEMETY